MLDERFELIIVDVELIDFAFVAVQIAAVIDVDEIQAKYLKMERVHLIYNDPD